MTHKISCLFFLLNFFFLTASCFSQDREIFVPETELGALFEGAADRVLMKRNEFETLREQTRKIRQESKQEQEKEKPPAEAVLLESDYHVEIADLRAVIDGTLEIELLTNDPVAIPLPFSNVALLEATLEDGGKPAVLREDVQILPNKLLILQGKKRHRLHLRLTTPLMIDSTRQRLNFRLPYGTKTAFNLSIPGDVELKNGAAVLSRKVENGATKFELLLPPGGTNGETELLMTLNSHRAGTYSAVLVRSVQFAEVTEQYERLHATISLNELHQGVREAAFSVPSGFEITEVRSTFLDRWNVQKSDGDPKKDILNIRLREQTAGLTTIYLSAMKTNLKKETKIDWQFPLFEPINAAANSAVLGLLLDQELEMFGVETKQFFPVDTMSLKNAIPPGAFESLPGSPTLRLAAAWYAPGKNEGDKKISAVFCRPETDCRVETVQNLILSEDEPVLQYTANITPRTGKIFETTLELPENWKILTVQDAAGQSLDFRPKNPGKTTVRFAKGYAAGETVSFSLRAAGHLPHWFENNTEKSLSYPVIRMGETTNEQGKISVQNNAEDDWEIVPVQTENLWTLNNALLFQYHSTPFALDLQLKKLSPRLKARTVSFYRFEPALLRVHYEIDYSIEQVSTRRLSFLLPLNTPATPSISGLNGLVLKETFSTETELEEQKFRRWEILLTKPMSGAARLGIDFEQPLGDLTFELPQIHAENVAWQSGLVAIEGDEELDLTIPTTLNSKPILRAVDAGELSASVDRPGKRLLGVYSVFDEKSPVTVEIRKNVTAKLVSALIRNVSATARLTGGSDHPGILYSTQYAIETGGSNISVKATLGETDELWSVTLDTQTMKPQRVGNEILIPVPAGNDSVSRKLTLIYCTNLRAKDSLKLTYPSLSLAGRNEEEKIPVMQTSWKVIPPSGYEIIQLGDSERLRPPPEPAIFDLFRGGFVFFSALTYRPSIELPQFGCSSREAGRSIRASLSTPGAPAFHYDEFVTGIEAESSFKAKSDADYSGGGSFERESLRKNATRNPAVDTLNYPDAVVQDESKAIRKPDATVTWKSDVNTNRSGFVSGQDRFSVTARRRLQSAQPVSIIVSGNDTPDRSVYYSVIGQRAAQEIPVRLVNIADENRLGITAALIVVLLGLFGLTWTRPRRTAFVFGMMFFGTIFIFVPGLEQFATVFNGIVYGAALTGAVYLADTLRRIVTINGKSCSEQTCSAKPGSSIETAIPALLVLFTLFAQLFCIPVYADEPEEKLPKIVFPDHSIIVPYSPDKISEDALPGAKELTSPEQSLLVPYKHYIEMLELLRNKETAAKNVQKFIVPFVVSAAEYQTVLPDAGKELTLRGKIRIDVFTDQAVLIPLPLENGVFEQPLLDGKPASLKSQDDHQTVLYVEGKGVHELLFTIHVLIQRQGGWRIVSGKLPVAAASKVLLTLPEESGDFLTGNSLDKKKWAMGKGKIIETILEPDGGFRWQWRSAVSEDSVDRNLEVDSTIRYDIQEDGVWIHWTPTFRISRGKWEMIRLRLPKDYLIAEISGENVRGWSVVQEDVSAKTIDVELLKPAESTEKLSILLSAPEEFLKPSTVLTLPKLSVPDAGIHQGRIHFYRSSRRSLRVTETSGLSLTDFIDETAGTKPVSKFDTASPLGMSLFQSYRFTSEEYSLKIEWKPVLSNPHAVFQSVLKLTEQGISLETKIQIQGQNKPFSVTIRLPEKFVLKNIKLPDGVFGNQYKKKESEKGNILNLFSGDGFAGTADIFIDGEYNAVSKTDRHVIEPLPLFSAIFSDEPKPSCVYQLAVLTTPSLDVRLENGAGINVRSIDSAFSWIPQQEQRDLIRLALYLSDDVGGRLVLSERKPLVRCSTITNVRTTAEAIEETTLLDFDITQAGIRNVEFVLPGWMKDAKIDAPLLRQKTVTPVASENSEPPVLVRLELHEEVMEQFRVLVQADRRLRSETDYNVSVPIIKIGQTLRQYIVMENDRRSPDEMVVDSAKLRNLQALHRQQREWAYLASILGGNVTEAYFAAQNSPEAGLSFKMRRRETVRLAEARIDLSETRLTLGENGVYRAEQIYRIDNKKEPYLDLLLPEGAVLWGARILSSADWQQKQQGGGEACLGSPVKPCAMPPEIIALYFETKKSKTPNSKTKGITKEIAVQESRLIRIPLVKTESGDLDYVIRLVYAGELRKFSNLSRLEMPFIDVLNIPVGESLVRLNLPERYAYQFNGNLQPVRQEQESETVQKVQLNYQRQQTDRLQQAVMGQNPFASRRAKVNLGQLNQSGQDSFGRSGQVSAGKSGMSSSVGIAYQVDNVDISAENTWAAGKSQDIDQDQSDAGMFLSNSATLNLNFKSQSNKSSDALVNQQALNRNETVKSRSAANASNSSFNDTWFASNSLSNSNGVNGETASGTPGNSSQVNSLQIDQLQIQQAQPTVYQPQSVPQPVPQQELAPAPQQPQRQTQQRGFAIDKGNIILRDQTEQMAQQPVQQLDSLRNAEEKSDMAESQSSFFRRKQSMPSSQVTQLNSAPQQTEAPMLSQSQTTSRGRRLSGESGARRGMMGGGMGGMSGSGNQSDKKDANAETLAELDVNAEEYAKFDPIAKQKSEKLKSVNEPMLPGLSTRTASLDIEIPQQGKTFLFTAAQGQIDLSFRMVSYQMKTRGIQAALAFLGLVFLYGLYRICFRIANRLTQSFDRRTHRNVAGLVTLLGCLTLLIAPLVFVLTMLLAAILWTTLIQKKSEATGR